MSVCMCVHCLIGHTHFFTEAVGNSILQYVKGQVLQGTLYFSPGDVAGQFIPALPACSGSTLTFRCTVAGSGTTLWRVNGSSNLCTLVHLSTSADTCGPSERIDTFTAIPETGFGVSGPSYSSTLSGTASSALDGTLVECFGPARSLDSGNRVGSSAIQVLGQ